MVGQLTKMAKQIRSLMDLKALGQANEHIDALRAKFASDDPGKSPIVKGIK